MRFTDLGKKKSPFLTGLFTQSAQGATEEPLVFIAVSLVRNGGECGGSKGVSEPGDVTKLHQCLSVKESQDSGGKKTTLNQRRRLGF